MKLKPTGFFHGSGPTPVIFGHHLGHEFLPTVWASLGIVAGVPLLAMIATLLIVAMVWIGSSEERRRRRAFEDAYARASSKRKTSTRLN